MQYLYLMMVVLSQLVLHMVLIVKGRLKFIIHQQTVQLIHQQRGDVQEHEIILQRAKRLAVVKENV